MHGAFVENLNETFLSAVVLRRDATFEFLTRNHAKSLGRHLAIVFSPRIHVYIIYTAIVVVTHQQYDGSSTAV